MTGSSRNARSISAAAAISCPLAAFRSPLGSLEPLPLH